MFSNSANDYLSTSSNSIQKGPYILQEAASNNVDTNARCPAHSYSQPYSTTGIMLSTLSDKSEAELRMILMDKDIYNKFLHSIGEVKYLDSLRNDLQMKTVQMARRNLEFACLIKELKNQCTIIRTTELAVAEEKLQELEIKEKELSVLSTPCLLQNLKDAARETDDESEQLQNLLFAREIEVAHFIPHYKRLRMIHHWQSLVHLAALSSSLS
eukprot:TRINITY_DN2357_c0_g1_i2.p1 TRINITY_DN2357_c0_g1~~TRINITY_DN2357_c0_g1_i2.p1  ORF type:complete len:213 (+),score=40.67 TRINITY_DN2357_c0_g1_i2:149-787(+)